MTPEYDIPEVLVLDFDRMLGDVEGCMKRLYVTAEAMNIRTEDIMTARRQTEDDGGTFEPISYIKGQLDEEQYEQFKYHFVNAREWVEENGVYSARPIPVLYPDAARFLWRLSYADIPHVIMTYGVNAEWQKLKLMAAGYPMGCTITDTPNKSEAIQNLRGTNGTFDMYVAAHGRAVYHASSLSFIDDKAKAFDDFPQDEAYRGYWLQRGELLPSQQGTVPRNVETISSLDDLMVTEDGKLFIGEIPEEKPFDSKEHRWRTDPYNWFNTVHSQYAVYLPLHPDLAIVEDDENAPDYIRNAPVIEFHEAS